MHCTARKPYIDNIRLSTVLLVMIYHVCYMFNGVGVLGGIPNAQNLPFFDALAYVVYPWFVVLLFVISGISARYSLQKRTVWQFLKERTVKLLVPSTLGLFVIHWVTGYLNLKMGGALEYIPTALVYPISVLSGIGPLWFIQMLFVFSCILALLKKADKNDRVWNTCKKANLPIILSLFFVIYGAAQILNMPVVTTYRFGIYFAAFLIGYYVFSHDEVQDKIESACIPMLCFAIIGAVFYTIHYFGSDYASTECLKSVVTNLYLWIAVLAVIGCAKKYCDRETAFTRYMTKSSFGFYILHYPVLIVICYFLQYRFKLPAICNYLIALTLEFLITFALYEVLKRVPIVRYLILGIKKINRNLEGNNAMPIIGKKIIVLGCPGSGKSTFSKQLHFITGLPLIHLDNIWWKPDKSHISREKFDHKLDRIFKKSAWIMDGDFSRTYEVRFQACDTLIFLDYDIDECMNGITERVGKKRSDIPWVAQELDPALVELVRCYPEENRPVIYSLIEKYSDKYQFIFHSRAEANEWLNNSLDK